MGPSVLDFVVVTLFEMWEVGWGFGRFNSLHDVARGAEMGIRNVSRLGALDHVLNVRSNLKM